MFNIFKLIVNNLLSKMKDSNSIESQKCLKFNANNAKRGQTVVDKQSKVGETSRLVVTKAVFGDRQLWAKQTVLVNRLTPNEIKRYDKHFYRKYWKQLKALNDYNKYSKLRHNLSKGNESPRMRLWKCNSPQKVVNNYTICRNKGSLKSNLVYDERESSLMNLSQFCRYLNLINCKELIRIPEQTLKMDFNIRNVGKTQSVNRDHKHNIVIESDSFINNMWNNYQSQKIKLKSKKKKKTKQKKLNFAVKRIKQKYKLMEKQKLDNHFAKQWKEQYMKCLSAFPLVSPMGQRVYKSLNNQCLDSNKIETLIKKNELYCSTKIRVRISSETKKINKWKCNNIEKMASGTDFTRSGPQGSHQYSFNKRQRLEKIKRFKTGINWRSRLLAMKCNKDLSIVLNKSILCPICKIKIEDNHCCDLSDRPQVKSNESQFKVPINKSTTNGGKHMKTQTKPYDMRNGSVLKLKNELQNAFVKIQRIHFNKIQRVLNIDLDEDNNRKVVIDLDTEENRVLQINLDNSFQSI